MSLVERVVDAAGGALWASIIRFRGYVSIKGSAAARLRETYDLQEIVAEGDIAANSIQISGFADATEWCVSPNFVTIRHGDGRFAGLRRPSDGWRPDVDGALEEIYVCALGIWMCMTLPLSLLSRDTETEELGPWSENGEEWRRLKVTAPDRGLAPARQKILYIDGEGMPRRVDFTTFLTEIEGLTGYCSAFQTFDGLTLPTLYRGLRRSADGELTKRPPYLDIEIFDAAFE